ncbi:MAG: type II toxin-antitoxin system RelE/ParE family toxin [Caldilineaceae bacterium]|nr:type II toxin-antitoxin system RelE/ParE family toxin [Caldilineaceae bacterium]
MDFDEERPKYRDKRTRQFAEGERVPAFQAFDRQAYRRLEVLESAPHKQALMALRSNRFEALKGDRLGQYSIRINRQWRICFEWPDDAPGPFNIEITDYH